MSDTIRALPRTVLPLVAVLAGCSLGYDPEQLGELEKMAEDAKVRAAAEDELRRAGLSAAAGIAVAQDAPACAVFLRTPDETEACLWEEGTRDTRFTVATISVVGRASAGTVRGPRVQRLESGLANEIEPVKGWVEATPENYAEKKAAIEALAADTYLPYDGTLVVDDLVPPSVTGMTFDSGTLKGTFYVWGYAEDALVCAAAVEARNSMLPGVNTAVDPTTGTQTASVDSLLCDLYRQGAAAGIAAAKSLTPAAAPAEPTSP